ncbi:MAG: hypothetical protein AABX35_03590 [Nanoarchaeota archaeon]|mgnify:CR=1 FL=1
MSNDPVIWQSFILDAEHSDEPHHVKFRRESQSSLERDLIKKGYRVMTPGSSVGGAFTSLMVGCSLGKNPKPDFYELSAKYGYHYRSGDFFSEFTTRD